MQDAGAAVGKYCGMCRWGKLVDRSSKPDDPVLHGDCLFRVGELNHLRVHTNRSACQYHNAPSEVEKRADLARLIVVLEKLVPCENKRQS